VGRRNNCSSLFSSLVICFSRLVQLQLKKVGKNMSAEKRLKQQMPPPLLKMTECSPPKCVYS
jgi:hypothetical protein